jgi:transposase InsO family protein
MDQFTRRLIGFGVHAGAVDGVALCRMFNKAISRMGAPRYLSSDNDPLFTYPRWQANLRVLDVNEIKTVPFVPISSPFVERLIGTIRRECLEQMFFWNTIDLERKLGAFGRYFTDHRVHSSLDGDTAAAASGEAIETRADLCNFTWRSHCRGLYQLPIAA